MKRMLDFIIAAGALLVVSPVLAFCALAIAVSMGRPIIFRQIRAGLRGEPFILMKFRTMSMEKNPYGALLPDDHRLTALGRFLRAASLDELPQLWNVIIGEMSLVGPRPLLPEYVPLYAPEHRRRLDVKPGITGWAAVNGRNSQPWESIFSHDIWYVDNQSFALDLKILWLTGLTVLSRRGIERGNANSSSYFDAPAADGLPCEPQVDDD
jgi:lipopolysaccharide/colanic/teichoic acid biosynthesis glycosyltransferase